MSYHADDLDPFGYRRRPTRRPGPRPVPPATPPATTTQDAARSFLADRPPAERDAWVAFADAAAEPNAELLGTAIAFTSAKLGGGSFWEVADDLLTAADTFGRVWVRGGYGAVIDPRHILRTLVRLPLFARLAEATSDVFGSLVLVAAEYHAGAGDRGAVLDAAEEYGEAYLRAAGVLHLIRGDDHDHDEG